MLPGRGTTINQSVIGPAWSRLIEHSYHSKNVHRHARIQIQLGVMRSPYIGST